MEKNGNPQGWVWDTTVLVAKFYMKATRMKDLGYRFESVDQEKDFGVFISTNPKVIIYHSCRLSIN